MKKTVLTFGIISGAISSLMMLSTIPFVDKIGFDKGVVLGYTAIVLSFLLVFFGIYSYRENVGEGKITFGRAFKVGILITLISCLFYVVTWQIVYFNFMPDFADKFAAHQVEQLRASGAGEAAIEAKIQEMNQFKHLYDNPLFNAAITFTEPFPVGLLITLISAAILRRKETSQTSQVADSQAAR